jgi:Pyridoxamine 5'-phosphate oxidase
MADTVMQADMGREESLRLLGSVPMGRVVFTHRALPAIRPVNHIVEGQQIVFRTDAAAAITTAVDGTGTIVAFEADAIDPFDRIGWSVVVVGGARLLLDDAQLGHYQKLLQPWADGAEEDVIVIQADMVTGIRLARTDAARS